VRRSHVPGQWEDTRNTPLADVRLARLISYKLEKRLGITGRFDLSLKENMAQDAGLQKQIQRIGEMVEDLETDADPSARAMAKELLESLMALHGAAIERILELAAAAGEPGEAIIRKCGRDELVSSVLLLYGLHPENLTSRVTYALEKSRNYLQSHSAAAELTSIGDDATVTVRLAVKAGGCGSSGASIRTFLEAAIQDAAPDASSIVVNETPSGPAFVPLTQLQSARLVATAPPEAAVPQVGD
jgi:Fe-S cluster biogenesis protein NfuA